MKYVVECDESYTKENKYPKFNKRRGTSLLASGHAMMLGSEGSFVKIFEENPQTPLADNDWGCVWSLETDSKMTFDVDDYNTMSSYSDKGLSGLDDQDEFALELSEQGTELLSELFRNPPQEIIEDFKSAVEEFDKIDWSKIDKEGVPF